MPNTTIQLKKSSTPSSKPLDLANGELAINFADGKLYYKNTGNFVVEFTGSGSNFGTVSANGTLLVSDTPGDILTIAAGNNINIVADALTDRLTISLGDNVIIPSSGTFKVNAVGGDEGGEIRLGNAITNSGISGDIVIDVWQNHLRFFESGGTNRGAYINLALAATSVGTNLLASSSGTTDTVARDTAAGAFAKANAALPNTSGVSFAGTLNFPSGNINMDSGRFYVVAPSGLTPFGVYGAGGDITWDFNGTSVSYLDSNTIYFRSGYPDNTERMRIDPQGNIRIKGADSTVSLELGNWLSDAYIGTNTGDALFIRTNGINRARWGSTGGMTSYGSYEISVDALNADFYLNSVGGTGRRYLLNSSTGGSFNIYDSTASNNRLQISGSGTVRFQTANGNTTHSFDYSSLGGRMTLSDDTGTSATRLEQWQNATRLLELIDGSDLILGFSSSTVANGNIMFMRPGYVEVARFDNVGRFGIGTLTPSANIQVNGNMFITMNNASSLDVIGEIAEFAHNANSYAQIHVRNANTGTRSSGDVVVTADVGTDTSDFIDFGINNSNYNDPAWTITGARDGYIYTSNGNIAIGTANTGKSLIFFTGGTLSTNEDGRFDPSGNLLIARTNSTVGQGVKVDVNGAINASAFLVNGTPLTSGTGGGNSVPIPLTQDAVSATRYLVFANNITGNLVTANVTAGFTFNPSSNSVTINGALNAVTKSFVINHPTKKGMMLRYGSLEGPENGVYARGRIQGNYIYLPDYWKKLVDKNSITVSLTPIGKTVMPSVLSWNNEKVVLHSDSPIDCFYYIVGERKDVDKLIVEY